MKLFKLSPLPVLLFALCTISYHSFSQGKTISKPAQYVDDIVSLVDTRFSVEYLYDAKINLGGWSKGGTNYQGNEIVGNQFIAGSRNDIFAIQSSSSYSKNLVWISKEFVSQILSSNGPILGIIINDSNSILMIIEADNSYYDTLNKIYKISGPFGFACIKDFGAF